jgi:hypothetical protein
MLIKTNDLEALTDYLTEINGLTTPVRGPKPWLAVEGEYFRRRYVSDLRLEAILEGKVRGWCSEQNRNV